MPFGSDEAMGPLWLAHLPSRSGTDPNTRGSNLPRPVGARVLQRAMSSLSRLSVSLASCRQPSWSKDQPEIGGWRAAVPSAAAPLLPPLARAGPLQRRRASVSWAAALHGSVLV